MFSFDTFRNEIDFLPVSIIVLIVIGIVIHRYLTAFWELNSLPNPRGFLLFANIFAIVYLVNFVWIFGFIVGIILFLLTFFQIIYSSFLWVFLLPQLINIRNKPIATHVNPIVYGLWSFIVVGLGVLIIINIVVSDYGSLTNAVIKGFHGNYITAAVSLIGAMVAGNIIRFIVSNVLGPD